MPQWIHDRADHILSKNPSMPKGQAFAIATQQSYAAGKAPKTYGTEEGRRTAHKKYDSPKGAYKKTAKPSSKSKSAGIDLNSLLGFSDELQKISAATPSMATGLTDVKKALDNSKRMSLSKPKATSVPQPTVELKPVQDSLSSGKTTPPPPITA